MIIGIAGTNSSGKDSVASILEKGGYRKFSLSDAIRYEVRSRD